MFSPSDKERMSRRTSFAKVTKQYLASLDLVFDKSTHFNPYAGKSFDLFGFADWIAVDPVKKQIIAIQETSISNKSARIKKILAEQRALAWVLAGGKIWVLCWKKVARTSIHGRMKTFFDPFLFYVIEEDFLENRYGIRNGPET